MKNPGLFAKLMKLDSRQVKKYGQLFRELSAFWTVLFSEEIKEQVKEEGTFQSFLTKIELPRDETTIPISINFLEEQKNTLEQKNEELKDLIKAVNADIEHNEAQIAHLDLAITHLKNMLLMIDDASNELEE